MTLTNHDLSELLAALKAGEMTETVRTSLQWVLQALIQAEVTAVIGAEPHERAETRTTQRNGHRPKLVSTAAGDIELGIPKLRSGSFFPSLLERRRRIDRALYAVVMEAYVHGVSTRKVDDLVAALGIASGISKSEVSRICAELDVDLAAFRSRPLGHAEFPYVFADATYVKARVKGRVVSRAVVVATGVTATGDREVLGVEVGDSESGAFWSAFFKGLRARGLSGVKLVISDHHLGLQRRRGRRRRGRAWPAVPSRRLAGGDQLLDGQPKGPRRIRGPFVLITSFYCWPLPDCPGCGRGRRRAPSAYRLGRCSGGTTERRDHQDGGGDHEPSHQQRLYLRLVELWGVRHNPRVPPDQQNHRFRTTGADGRVPRQPCILGPWRLW